MKSKKAQGWGFDVIFASMIFISAILIFYIYTLNNSNQSEETFSSMQYDGNLIGNMLLSEGLPLNWDSSDVIAIGISSDNKINETKLEKFYNLSITNYPKTTSIFHTKVDYFINFSQPIKISEIDINGIGKPIAESSNLVKITRVTIYKDKLITLNIYLFK